MGGGKERRIERSGGEEEGKERGVIKGRGDLEEKGRGERETLSVCFRRVQGIGSAEPRQVAKDVISKVTQTRVCT